MNINALMSWIIFLLNKLLIKFMCRTSFKITVSLWPDTKIIFVNKDNTGLWCGTFSRKWLCCALVTAGVTKQGAISFLAKVKTLCYSRLGKSRLINICQCLKVYLYPLEDFQIQQSDLTSAIWLALKIIHPVLNDTLRQSWRTYFQICKKFHVSKKINPYKTWVSSFN